MGNKTQESLFVREMHTKCLIVVKVWSIIKMNDNHILFYELYKG